MGKNGHCSLLVPSYSGTVNHVDPDTTISQVDTTARDKFYQKRLKSAIFQNLKIFIFQSILMQFLEVVSFNIIVEFL
jgi:hypothetical protein